jgi:uncharacterized protein
MLELIGKYYSKWPKAGAILCKHSMQVAQKAQEIARGVPELDPDMDFIREAALLHDIGIFKTNAPALDCHGDLPYICHGVAGHDILDSEGLYRHALVCERHIGVGLTADDIKRNDWPMPMRDMTPLTIEEVIISVADLFSSKSENGIVQRSLQDVKKAVDGYGPGKLDKLNKMLDKLKIND